MQTESSSGQEAFISCIKLQTGDKQLYQKTLNFYIQLGFEILKTMESSSLLHFYSESIGIDLEISMGQESTKSSFVLCLPTQIPSKTTDPLGNDLTITNIPPHPKQISEKIKFHSRSTSPQPPAHVLPAHSRRIGILTSGGDSCGMNAAVRSITRVALQRGCVPYAIYEGYQGLVDGNEKIKELTWDDVRGYLAKGGTVIGTARCAAFRTREGRLKACLNLIKHGIDALVVIGGDGSLTGADTFRSEWTGLVDELVEKGETTTQESDHLKSELTIVGLVGSIDNDMSMTDITIGAVTSLHRICESVDSLVSTAQSHQRAFVVEVMGRHCGWLALMAAIAVGADCVFFPENPPPINKEKYGNDWEKEMCDIVAKNRAAGNRKTLVIVAEGAHDRDLNPIKPEAVKKVLENILHLDTRVTTLGHVQRGGSTCAYDRYLATVQGVAAVDAVLKSTRDSPAPMIGMSHNEIISVPLMDAVKMTQDVTAAIARKDFGKAMELRDPEFISSYRAYIESSLMAARVSSGLPENERLRIGIMHCGAPAGGMNAATRVLVRLCLSRGHTPLGIKNGFSGLVNGEIINMQWEDVRGWQTAGGSQLGTNRDHPTPIPGITSVGKPSGVDDMVETGEIAYHLQKNKIQALILIGGFEAFSAQLTLTEARKIYPSLCIPMVHVPATISNNMPATDFSIGSDTALNVIVEACDSIKLSANASRKRVFVVEVHGGNCGYLSTLSALTIGATASYIPEEGLSLDLLQSDVKYLVRRYTEEVEAGIANEGRVFLRSESALPAVYSTSFISGMLQAEGKGLFDSRQTVLGHLQQGDVPSPLDRIRATRLACKAIDQIQLCFAEVANDTLKPFVTYTKKDSHSVSVGFRGANIVATPVFVAEQETDMKRRTVKKPWWIPLRSLINVLGRHGEQSSYGNNAKL